MPRDLSDRVIVITGASSGIGEATAIACAKAGMDVVLAARRVDRLEALAERIQRLKRQALAVACDVDQDRDVAKLVSKAMDRFSRIDAFFANAGYGLMASIEDTTDAQLRAIFETNFFGTMRCVRSVMPVFRKQGHGHLLICTSVVSELSVPMYGAYAATKAAQDSVASALRAEVAGAGIDVTTVHPTGTRTEFGKSARTRAGRSDIIAGTPRALEQTVGQVAGAIVRALRRPRAEVWPSPVTRFAAGAATLFPQFGAWFMRRLMLPRMQPHRPSTSLKGPAT